MHNALASKRLAISVRTAQIVSTWKHVLGLPFDYNIAVFQHPRIFTRIITDRCAVDEIRRSHKEFAEHSANRHQRPLSVYMGSLPFTSAFSCSY